MALKLSLDAWIRECLSDPDKQTPLTMIALVHHRGDVEQELHSTKLPDRGAQIDPLDMANMFMHKAQAYAQELPGVQTFSLLAFYGGSNQPLSRQPSTARSVPVCEFDFRS